MSLNDYARLSNNDLELYKQLSDSSYRSINGKRQNSRNFKEGVLNLGQINFEQPKNVLTKEMILEYQKEQQNKPAYEDATGDKFKYLPSNVNDPLNPYNPTPLPSGAAATENDIGNKKSELNNALKDFNKLENEEDEKKERKKKLEEYKIKLQQKEIIIADKLNKASTEEVDTDNEIQRIDAELPKIKKLLDAAIKGNFSTKDKHQKDYDALNVQKKEQEKKLKEIKNSIPTLKKQESETQTIITHLDNQIITLDARLNDTQTEKGQLQSDIPNLEAELKQITEN